MNYTQGKWYVSADGFSIETENEVIADLRLLYLPTVKANGRLIAAAPALVETVQCLLTWYHTLSARQTVPNGMELARCLREAHELLHAIEIA